MVIKTARKSKPKKAPNPDDYKGILTKEETRKRAKRRKKEDAKAAEPELEPKSKGGRPKGTFSLRTILRKLLQESRGNRPLYEHLMRALIDAAISGDKNFNTSASKIVIEHLEGKPMQTIVADVTNRDGYADKTDEELLRIAAMRPLSPEDGDDDDIES